MVSRETPLEPTSDGIAGSSCEAACAPVLTTCKSVKGMPWLLYHLGIVQALVFIGITAWNVYAEQWFGHTVFGGDNHAPKGSPERMAYAEGVDLFTRGGQYKSILQLHASLVIIAILLRTQIR